MKTLDRTFETNANASGIMNFVQLQCEQNASHKNVYLYQRIRKDGRVFGFEVFIPTITRAGTIIKFPNGITKTIDEDTENYPGASVFGFSAWFFSSLGGAKFKFKELLGR